MKTIIDINKNKAYAMANAVARMSGKEKIKREEIIENNGVFFIDININKTTVEKLPKTLQKNIFDTKEKEDIIVELSNDNLNPKEKGKLIKVKLNEKREQIRNSIS